MPPQKNTVLHDLGLDTLPEEDRDELNAEIGEVVFAGVMRRVWDKLDFHQQDALTALFRESEREPDNDEKRIAIATFLDTQVPEFAQYVREELDALVQSHSEALNDTV